MGDTDRGLGAYIGKLHLVGIATLAVLIVALAAVGWSIRPASGGFPTVPSDLGVLVGSPASAHFTESLTLTPGAGATMRVFDLSTATSTAPWTLYLNNIGTGHVCTKRSYTLGAGGGGAISVVPLSPQMVSHPKVPTVGAVLNLTEVQGRGTVYVQVCWPSDAPAARNGAYLSAVFPPISSDNASGFYVATRQLNLGSLDAADYVLQSVSQPTSATQGGWQWSPRFPAGQAITLSAVDTSETQHDSYRAFLSGIVLGVAGGALVALIQELVAPFRTRRELRPPEPGG